jgi:hypothetical protein
MIENYDTVDVFIVVDVGKGEHQAVALDKAGKRLFDKALPNDEAKLRQVIRGLADHGRALLVVDQPATIGALPVAVAHDDLASDRKRSLNDGHTISARASCRAVAAPTIPSPMTTTSAINVLGCYDAGAGLGAPGPPARDVPDVVEHQFFGSGMFVRCESIEKQVVLLR